MEGIGLRLRTIVVITTCFFSRSLDDPYFGISTSTFSQKILSVLMDPVNELDVEIKPDGMRNLPCMCEPADY